MEDSILLTLTNDGKIYNPLEDEKLLKQDSIKKLKKLDCNLSYDELLGFNKIYININKQAQH